MRRNSKQEKTGDNSSFWDDTMDLGPLGKPSKVITIFSLACVAFVAIGFLLVAKMRSDPSSSDMENLAPTGVTPNRPASPGNR